MPRRARSGEVIDRPDHAGSTYVKARVTVLDTIILRMRWPEAHRVACGAGILNDIVDGLLSGSRIPTQRSARSMRCDVGCVSHTHLQYAQSPKMNRIDGGIQPFGQVSKEASSSAVSFA